MSEQENESERRWSRSDWLALSGVSVSAISAIAALVVLPGIRDKIGIDSSSGASSATAGATTSAAAPEATATAQSAPSATETAARRTDSPSPGGSAEMVPASATVTRPPACTSFTACIASCEAGAAMSCAASGDMALGGTDGATKDEARAYELFDRACKADDPNGCTSRGWLELNGKGTTKNPQAALASFSRACEGSTATVGCFGMGVILRGGHGITSDEDRAATFFKRGCDGGNRAACKALDQLEKK